MWSLILLVDAMMCFVLSLGDYMGLMNMKVSHFAMIVLIALIGMSKVGESNRKGKR